jgi:catechol 2,3-dioxygenase-like lactoylglutathione lyase family enzyme
VCDHGITHLCLDVDDLDADYKRLLGAGVTFHSPPQDLGAGVRTCYGRDPDGNVVELQQLSPLDHRFAVPHAQAASSPLAR